jgi:uncharacterized protein
MTAHRLKAETSPYLLQHRDDPVDWHPWGDEALTLAANTDRPIFLSVGYSACHWCHVMQRDSFRHSATAALLNTWFICVKVDRDERPDIDALAMASVVALTGGGGWPLTVFCTPEGMPFQGGTYYPIEPRDGLPSFLEVARTAVERWQADPEEVRTEAAALSRDQQLAPREYPPVAPNPAPTEMDGLLERSVTALGRRFDPLHSGFGGAPKFPPTMALDFLLARHAHGGGRRALRMATRTLDAMAAGGIYDQLGGGFHRYAVDAAWTVPHFEKMLSDNALLAAVYLHAWTTTGTPRYRAVCEQTLEYLLRELRLPEGGFASSQDAETGGVEGAPYVWKHSELAEVLDVEELRIAVATFGVTRQGVLPGGNVLQLQRNLDVDGATHQRLCDKLLRVRMRREQPTRDTQVIASANGLALASLAEAGYRLERPDYLDAAQDLAGFLLTVLDDGNDGLLHVYAGGVAKIPGFLDDYAALSHGLVELATATGDLAWLEHARRLASVATRRLYDPDVRVFRFEAGGAQVNSGSATFEDRQLPAGNPSMATALLRIARLTGDAGSERRATEVLTTGSALLVPGQPRMGGLLLALECLHGPALQVAIVGDFEDPSTAALTGVLRRWYDPASVTASRSAATGPASPVVPFLIGKSAVEGRATAYVCTTSACLPPCTDAGTLRAALATNRMGLLGDGVGVVKPRVDSDGPTT